MFTAYIYSNKGRHFLTTAKFYNQLIINSRLQIHAIHVLYRTVLYFQNQIQSRSDVYPRNLSGNQCVFDSSLLNDPTNINNKRNNYCFIKQR